MIETAKEVLKAEAEAVLRLCDFLDHSFSQAVEMIDQCEGRLILSGMGKSGLIARKISATFASLGISSTFMHPAEAIHGDLGMIRPRDIVLAISNSGETAEIIRLVPFIRTLGGKIISMTGNLGSFLARNSDVALYCGVEKEACHLNLAPTSSTTAALALGDALAVATARKRNVDQQEFARYHPGGSLGQKLLYTVSEVMHTGKDIPVVKQGISLREAVKEISARKLGFTIVVNMENRLSGIVTDGDIRRMIDHGQDPSEPVENFMGRNPRSVTPDTTIADALTMMERFAITSLIVLDRSDEICGVVHLHDLLGRGKLRMEV